MNRAWIREQLESFIDLATKFVGSKNQEGRTVGGDRTLVPELLKAEPTIERIFAALDHKPRYALRLDTVSGARETQAEAHRALGILDRMDEWAANLKTDAPALPADLLHPWVWDAARTFWDSQHYRAAVDAAATAINAHTQTKVGRRDIFDVDLMNHIFTEKPRDGQTYLRLAGDDGDLTTRNRNRALRPFAEGCFAGIRNPAAHEHGDDWSQQIALEYLASLSVLARWISGCEVHVHDEE